MEQKGGLRQAQDGREHLLQLHANFRGIREREKVLKHDPRDETQGLHLQPLAKLIEMLNEKRVFELKND